MVGGAEYESVAVELLPTLYKIAMGMLRCDADARDAVQQALLKAWETRGRARAGAMRGYMTRILINECHNIQRRRMRVFPAEMPPVQDSLPPDYGELREAIASLPEELRLPVYLKYLQNFSEREAASALRIPVATLKNRLYRARKRLREQLMREVTFE